MVEHGCGFAQGVFQTEENTFNCEEMAAPPSPSPPPSLLLPASILSCSPSRRDGLSASLERAYRLFGCELIQECGIRLYLPQVVMATAQALLHRFYYRKSLRDFDAHIVAMSSLFLAAKVEEKQRRMRDILNVCYSSKLRRQGAAPKPLLLGGPVSFRGAPLPGLWFLYQQRRSGDARCAQAG